MLALGSTRYSEAPVKLRLPKTSTELEMETDEEFPTERSPWTLTGEVIFTTKQEEDVRGGEGRVREGKQRRRERKST